MGAKLGQWHLLFFRAVEHEPEKVPSLLGESLHRTISIRLAGRRSLGIEQLTEDNPSIVDIRFEWITIATLYRCLAVEAALATKLSTASEWWLLLLLKVLLAVFKTSDFDVITTQIVHILW